jgi:NAD-dependent deacetylase
MDFLQAAIPSPQSDPTLTYLKDISEIAKNFVEALAVLAGAFALFKWLRERHDRAIDVMVALETRFSAPQLSAARLLIEDDNSYKKIAPILMRDVVAALDARQPRPTDEEYDAIGGLDDLLRFYLFLYGVRKAKQVPDSSLRASYRYWLTLYFHPARTAFRAYVDWFFPTLSAWLRDDERREKSPFRKRFFTPRQYGWIATDEDRAAQFRRGIEGSVMVLTGSGISADSKIPTFRGKDGLWRKENPKRLATTKAFTENPKKIWDWYNKRREKIRASKPNAAHSAVVQLEKQAKRFLLVTQNVDDLHERALFEGKGLPAEAVVHIHGRIFASRCSKCDYKDPEEPGAGIAPIRKVGGFAVLPHCPKCGELMRPGVVWFDEENNDADERRVEEFLAEKPCDLVLVIGTTATFDYIRRWALQAAASGAWFVEINPEASQLSRFAHHGIRSRAKKVLPRMVQLAVEKGPVYLG